jgi:sugar lactone lactonase YvrE
MDVAMEDQHNGMAPMRREVPRFTRAVGEIHRGSGQADDGAIDHEWTVSQPPRRERRRVTIAAMSFTTLVTGIDFGEGPRWNHDRLWYSDFYQHQVRSVDLSGGQRVELEIDDQPSGLGWLPDGRLLVVAMRSRLVLRVEADGTVVTHADLSDLVEDFCNDMVVDADGHAWVGNFGFDLVGRGELATTRLVHVTPAGDAAMVGDELVFPNGAVITPDGGTLIVGETFGAQYRAFTIGADKLLSDGRVWARVDGSFPDGCTLDADGGIWFADAAGARCLRVVEGGEVTHELPTPQPVYACMLGGPDGRTLFALTAVDSRPARAAGTATGTIEVTSVEVPHAGLP